MSGTPAPYESSRTKGEQGGRFRMWRRRGRIVLMLVALVLATKLFLESSMQPPAAAPIPEPEGDLSRVDLSLADVREPLQEAARLAAHCSGSPDRGDVQVAMSFRPDGHVRELRVLPPSLEHTEVAECIETIFRRVSLPSFSGGELWLRQGFRFQR